METKSHEKNKTKEALGLEQGSRLPEDALNRVVNFFEEETKNNVENGEERTFQELDKALNTRIEEKLNEEGITLPEDDASNKEEQVYDEAYERKRKELLQEFTFEGTTSENGKELAILKNEELKALGVEEVHIPKELLESRQEATTQENEASAQEKKKNFNEQEQENNPDIVTIGKSEYHKNQRLTDDDFVRKAIVKHFSYPDEREKGARKGAKFVLQPKDELTITEVDNENGRIILMNDKGGIFDVSLESLKKQVETTKNKKGVVLYESHPYNEGQSFADTHALAETLNTYMQNTDIQSLLKDQTEEKPLPTEDARYQLESVDTMEGTVSFITGDTTENQLRLVIPTEQLKEVFGLEIPNRIHKINKHIRKIEEMIEEADQNDKKRIDRLSQDKQKLEDKKGELINEADIDITAETPEKTPDFVIQEGYRKELAELLDEIPEEEGPSDDQRKRIEEKLQTIRNKTQNWSQGLKDIVATANRVVEGRVPESADNTEDSSSREENQGTSKEISE